MILDGSKCQHNVVYAGKKGRCCQCVKKCISDGRTIESILKLVSHVILKRIRSVAVVLAIGNVLLSISYVAAYTPQFLKSHSRDLH